MRRMLNVLASVGLLLLTCTAGGLQEKQEPAAGHSDRHPIRVAGRWGDIDHTGKMVIQPRFDEVAVFSEGLAAVRIGHK